MACACAPDTRPGCPFGWLWESCMCWICACNSACVSKCIMALCMTISNDSAVPPRLCLQLLICRAEIISRKKTKQTNTKKNLCFCESPLCCCIPFVVFRVGGLGIYFSSLIFSQICSECYLRCQDCLNYKKGSNF